MRAWWAARLAAECAAAVRWCTCCQLLAASVACFMVSASFSEHWMTLFEVMLACVSAVLFASWQRLQRVRISFTVAV